MGVVWGTYMSEISVVRSIIHPAFGIPARRQRKVEAAGTMPAGY
jgi:hypothetical protein